MRQTPALAVGLATAAAVTVPLLAGLPVAEAGSPPVDTTPYVYVTDDSAYAINTFTDGGCQNNRLVVRPGKNTAGNIARRSYRVNAVSYARPNGGVWGYRKKNACVPLSETYQYFDVRVIKN